MKPTEKQIQIIDTIRSILNTWKNTNDLNSPTHYSDIDELIQGNLEDILSEWHSSELSGLLCTILDYIQNIPRYNVGDTVTIRSKEWHEAHKDDYSYIKNFEEDIPKYCGKKAIIHEVCVDGYLIDLDNHAQYWCDDFFED